MPVSDLRECDKGCAFYGILVGTLGAVKNQGGLVRLLFLGRGIHLTGTGELLLAIEA